MTALTTSERITALREGGWTDRMHTVIKHRRYGVDAHSWGALNLALILFPDDITLNLVKAIQWHDVPERWVGDSPWPAKYPMSNGELASCLKAQEKRIEKILEISVELTTRESAILCIVDMLELILWAREEVRLGNQHVKGTLRNGLEAIRHMDLYDEIASDIADLITEPNTEEMSWWKELIHGSE